MNGYREPARSYRTLLPLVALLLALFLVDVRLGGAGAHWIGVHGAVTHLPGWILFGAVLVGIQALILYAARATHSLTLSDDELRVGEESIRRTEIAAAEPGVDGDLPVLGWPTGRSRAGSGLVVRRADGAAAFVPCRHPDRLAAALAVVQTTPDVDIRPASEADLAAVPEIDERAEAVFRVAGYELPRIAFDVDGLAEARAVFVVGRPPVGYVQVDEVDGVAHIAELAVLPANMRQGTGGALLKHACAWAGDAGYRAVTLVTYADVPWNAPFYAEHGFVEAPADTPELARRKKRQTDLGLDEVGRRIVMRRAL